MSTLSSTQQVLLPAVFFKELNRIKTVHKRIKVSAQKLAHAAFIQTGPVLLHMRKKAMPAKLVVMDKASLFGLIDKDNHYSFYFFL